MFHVRRRPADYHPRKRKKKPQQTGKWSKDALEGRYEDAYDRLPFFLELNPDGSDVMSGTPQRHRLHPNVTEVGSERPVNGHQAAQSQSQCLTLHGPHVMPRHCVVAHTEGIVTVTPCSRDSETYVNGVRIYETTILQNGATVKFGRLHNFRFIDPNYEDRNRQRLAHEYSYDRQSRDGPVSPAGGLNSTSGGPVNSTQNYETTFDVDGNVETVSTSSLGNKDETRSQRSVCSSRDGNRLSNYERYPRGSDAILPAVLEFREETEDAFLHAIIPDLDPNTVALKLAPTYTLYLAARYRASTHYQPELTPTERAHRLTILLARVACMVQNVIEERYTDSLSLAFWMANASELLHFLKSDRHVSAFSLDAQDILAQAVQISFRNLVSCLQGELAAVMPTFMSEKDDPEESASVLQVLVNTMSLLRCCRVNAALTIQLFSQLFHFINVWAFNCIVTSPSPASSVCYCSRAWGLRFKARLAQLEVWAERQGLELAADCHLARIIQAAHLLQGPKYTAEDLATISSTCFKLNSLQLRTLLTKYQPAADEPRLSPELIENVVAENVADELARTDGREVQLTEEPLLQLPFLLPEDGYSCDVIRGVPQELIDFLTPLSHAGLCRMTLQPTSSGLWTVYQMQDTHPGARSPSAMSNRSGGFQPPMQHQHPEYQLIKLHKSNNGMGLSIVAAKGAGQDRLGIYIKSVVKGGAADIDGQLQAGDQLLKVDGQSLVGITQEKAAEYLVRTGPVVTLEVAKQGAIYHGLATLLSQPSPPMGRASPPRLSSPIRGLSASSSLGCLRPNYNERLSDWSSRSPRLASAPGAAATLLRPSTPAPRRPTSLGSSLRPLHRQYLSPFDSPNDFARSDSWQKNSKASCVNGFATPTFVVTPADDEDLATSTHEYLEVPVPQSKCYNTPEPGEICPCEEQALRANKEAEMKALGAAPKTSHNNWKADVIRLYRERLEKRELREKEKRLANPETMSTCSTAEADCESDSNCRVIASSTDSDSSVDGRGPSSATPKESAPLGHRIPHDKHPGDKLTDEEKTQKLKELSEIMSSLESIPETAGGRAWKYKVESDHFSENDTDNHQVSGSKPSKPRRSISDDFVASMFNLDLSSLNEESGESSRRSSVSLRDEVSPRELIFGCGRVAELTRHFSQLGESSSPILSRSKSVPDISPRTDNKSKKTDYTVVYSVGLKAIDFSVDHVEDSKPESVEQFKLGKVRVTECPGGDDLEKQESSGSEDSDSPWVQLRRLLRAESSVSSQDTPPLPPITEPSATMWARVKKLLAPSRSEPPSDRPPDFVPPNSHEAEEELPNSTYRSFDMLDHEPVMKSSISESCLASSTARERQNGQATFVLRGERSRSEEALLKKKHKRRVVFSCVKDNSDGDDSPVVRRYAVTQPEQKKKFPDDYIRTRSSQSVEDVRPELQSNLARHFVSMPHIMYMAGHTHLIPVRAHSAEWPAEAESTASQLYCARRMSERDLPSRVLSENHNTAVNGNRNLLPPHAPIHSSKSVPSLNTGGHHENPNVSHGPMGPMSPISPIMGPGMTIQSGRLPHHEVFNPGYSRTSSTTSIPQGLRSRSSQNLADPRVPNNVSTLPPMGLGSRQLSNPSIQPPQQQHSPNGYTAGPDGERFYQNLSVYRNHEMHNGYPPQMRGKLPSPQHPSLPQQDRSPTHAQKNLQNVQNMINQRGSQSSLHRDRPSSAYIPQNSQHGQIIPGMGGMPGRSQSSRDMIRQDAKLAEMQEEVRRRELRQQQGQLGPHPGQHVRPQMIGPLSPQHRIQGYPQAGPQHPPPTAPKPGVRPLNDGHPPQRPPLPAEDVVHRDSPPPPPPPTSTHPLYKPNPNTTVDSRYNATSEGAPRGSFYPAAGNNQYNQPGRHIQFATATNPWDREEKEREQIRRREAARQWRDQQIAELSSMPAKTPQQDEQLRALRLEREFQRRAEEAARHDDDDEDEQESPDRGQGLLRLASPNQAPMQNSPQQQTQQSLPQPQHQPQQRPYNQQNGIISRTAVPPSVSNEEKERQRRLEDMKRKQAEMEREREREAEERLKESQKRKDEEVRQQHQQQILQHHIQQFNQQRLPNQVPQSILNSPPKNNNVQFNNSLNNNNNNTNNNNVQNNSNRPGQYTSPLSGKHPAASHLRLDNLVMNGPATPQTPLQQYNGYASHNSGYQPDATSPVGPQQRLDSLLQSPTASEKPTVPPQPPERGSSYSVMMSQPARTPGPPSGPLSPTSSTGGLTRSCLVSTPNEQTSNTTKRVSFHDPNTSQPPPPPTSQPPPIREDPNHFINEAETLLASPKSPDGPGGMFVGSTPGVIGAQEVYRDPRQRRLAEQQQQQQKQQTARVPEKLTFKEKMKMFAMETGEDGTPRDKVKISRAQRDIDTISTPTSHNS